MGELGGREGGGRGNHGGRSCSMLFISTELTGVLSVQTRVQVPGVRARGEGAGASGSILSGSDRASQQPEFFRVLRYARSLTGGVGID